MNMNVVYCKFQKAMKPKRLQNLAVSAGIKTVQNIDSYVLRPIDIQPNQINKL